MYESIPALREKQAVSAQKYIDEEVCSLFQILQISLLFFHQVYEGLRCTF